MLFDEVGANCVYAGYDINNPKSGRVMQKIKLPCDSILLLGDKDQVGKVATYNKKWSNETGYPLVVIKNAAHNSNDDKPEEVNKIIEDFLLSIG